MYQIKERELTARATAVVRAELTPEQIKNWIGAAYGRVEAAVNGAGVPIAGPPFARYRVLEGSPRRFEVEAGFPLAEAVPPDVPLGDVRRSGLPAGRAAVTVHVGPYDAMELAYEALERWIAGHGGAPQGPAWETYLTEPTEDSATWRTEIVQPFG
jgi:effector-binding domain-containing protein